MIDTVAAVLRALLAFIGLLALADPAATGSLAAAAIVLLSLVQLTVAAIAAMMHAAGRGSPAHPTRRTELSAPLAQSDPDAAGHVRPRGPGQAAAAT